MTKLAIDMVEGIEDWLDGVESEAEEEVKTKDVSDGRRLVDVFRDSLKPKEVESEPKSLKDIILDSLS